MQDLKIRRELARQVQKLMLRDGVSERALARHIGVSHVTINRIIRSENAANYETVALIADHFGVSMDSLRGTEKRLRQPA